MKLTFNQPLSLSHAEEIVTVEKRSDTTHTGLWDVVLVDGVRIAAHANEILVSA